MSDLSSVHVLKSGSIGREDLSLPTLCGEDLMDIKYDGSGTSVVHEENLSSQIDAVTCKSCLNGVK